MMLEMMIFEGTVLKALLSGKECEFLNLEEHID